MVFTSGRIYFHMVIDVGRIHFYMAPMRIQIHMV